MHFKGVLLSSRYTYIFHIKNDFEIRKMALNRDNVFNIRVGMGNKQ